jgi:DNA-directed RNA polymerase specialized sigma24 family protein
MSVDKDSSHGAEPVRDNPVLTLVRRARDGDERAWAALVERYAPLIWSLCRRYQLDTTETADVGQNVWLLLVSHLGKIRDPAALPGWLATTTRRECRRVLNRAQVPHARHEPDAEISARLGIAVGSIGPNRRRCLDKLRHHPAIAALIGAEVQTA